VINKSGDYLGGSVTNESFSSLGVRGEFADLGAVPASMKGIQVRMRRLDTLLRERAIQLRDFGVLSIDVKGWELEVLSGLRADGLISHAQPVPVVDVAVA